MQSEISDDVGAESLSVREWCRESFGGQFLNRSLVLGSRDRGCMHLLDMLCAQILAVEVMILHLAGIVFLPGQRRDSE